MKQKTRAVCSEEHLSEVSLAKPYQHTLYNQSERKIFEKIRNGGTCIPSRIYYAAEGF